MSGMGPALFALAAAALVLAAAYAWLRLIRRPTIEQAAGIETLANMKWRECLGLLLRALSAKGYAEEVIDGEPHETASKWLLRRGNETCLLGYKHGTAYRIGDAVVREFAGDIRLHGADRGILATLGNVEGFARDLARQNGIELLDGSALWPMLRQHLADPVRQSIRRLSSTRVRSLLPMLLALSALAGGAAFVLYPEAPASPAPAYASIPAKPPIATVEADTARQQELHQQISDAAAAMEAIANLTDEELSSRRANAAASVMALQRVQAAHWSTQSTLAIALLRNEDSDRDVIDEACRILLQYEELRYTRLQLEPPPGSSAPVRWRQCQ